MEDKAYCCSNCSPNHPNHTLLPPSQARRVLYSTVNRLHDLTTETCKSLSTLQIVITKKLAKARSMEKAAVQEIENAYMKLKTRVENTQNAALQLIGNRFSESFKAVFAQKTAIRLVYDCVKEYQRLDDDLLFYSKIPQLSDNQAEAFVPVQISVDFPQLETISGYLANSYIASRIELEHSSLSKLLYLSRGKRDYSIYNFETDEITKKQLISEDLVLPYYSGFTVLPYQSVFLTGGKVTKISDVTNLVFMFSPENGQITVLESMRNARSFHVCLYANKAIYVLGGKNATKTAISACETYTFSTARWTDIPPMSIGRICASGVHNNGKIYVFGGSQVKMEDSIEVYTIEMSNWDLLPARLPEKMRKQASYVVNNTQILIFGGENRVKEASGSAYIYDLERISFSAAPQVPINAQKWPFSQLHITQRGNALFTMNKELQILKYEILSNEWSRFK